MKASSTVIGSAETFTSPAARGRCVRNASTSGGGGRTGGGSARGTKLQARASAAQRPRQARRARRIRCTRASPARGPVSAELGVAGPADERRDLELVVVGRDELAVCMLDPCRR